MLFRKKIAPTCAYCEYATQVDDELVICIKKGMRAANHKCGSFFYDPCKRIPKKQKAIDFKAFNNQDYSL